MKIRFHTSLLLFGVIYFSSLPVLAQWFTAALSQNGRAEIAATSAGNKALFAGGYVYNAFPNFGSGTNRVDIYDAVTNQWTTATLSQARARMAAISVGNLAFFAGGVTGSGVYGLYRWSAVDIYNAATNQWVTAQLSEGRMNIAVATAGGKVLFAGGDRAANVNFYSDVLDIYDIVTNTWSATVMPVIYYNIQATGVGNKLIINAQNGKPYIYDVVTKQWTASGPLSTGVARATLGSKAFFAGKTIYNPDNNTYKLTDQVDIYDASTNQWTTAQLSTARNNIAVISSGNKVFFAGGSSSTVVDIYDGTTGQWTTAQLSEGRSSISATSAGSKVFFAAGSGSSTVDIYDTATNQWSVTKLPQVKYQTAVLAVGAGERALFASTDYGDAYNTGRVDIYTTNSALPVNLIAFSGTWIENVGAQLHWQTSLETNNDHFEIQRSDNAKSFETIGRVQGKGTIEARTDYSFTDLDMPGQIGYYRLKQVDFDGSTHFSKIISVNRQESKPQAASLSIWPIPATGRLQLQLSASKISQITIYDLQGRQRLATQIESLSTADVSGLPAGVYLLDVLTTDGQHIHKHFLKQ